MQLYEWVVLRQMTRAAGEWSARRTRDRQARRALRAAAAYGGGPAPRSVDVTNHGLRGPRPRAGARRFGRPPAAGRCPT